MQDNILIAEIISLLQSGLAANGQGSIIIQQGFQPRQEGVPSLPTIFIHKIGDTRFGSPYRLNEWNPDPIAIFTASSTTTSLTVTHVESGSLAIGQTLSGNGIPNDLLIVGLGEHTTGKEGTYLINQPLMAVSQEMMTIAGMAYTETQQYLTTFQFSALATQDPSNITGLTASDIANLAASIMQSLSTITALEALGIGVLKIGEIRNPPFSDDRERWSYAPNFDCTFSTKQVVSSVQPVVTDTVLQVIPV